MEVVDNRFLAHVGSGEANVSIRANEDQRIAGDAISLMGVPGDVNQPVVLSLGRAV